MRQVDPSTGAGTPNLTSTHQVSAPYGSSSITFFPTLLDDELLYSAVARYEKQTASTDGSQTKRRLFGTSTLPALLPGNLDHFLAQLPQGAISAEQLIERHTLYPYFAPFIRAAAKRKTLRAMRESDGLAVKVSLGIPHDLFKPDYRLRFCVQCAQAQHKDGTPLYWKRAHQLPGVWRCPQHATLLLDRCLKCGPFDYRRKSLLLPDVRCGKCKSKHHQPVDAASPSLKAKEMRLAELSAELLETNLQVADPVLFSRVYKQALLTAGLIQRTEDAQREPIDAQIEAYWGKVLLKRLGVWDSGGYRFALSLLDDYSPSIWHPLRHLLLIGVLFKSIDELAGHPAFRTHGSQDR